VLFHPAVDRIAIVPALDPLWTIFFAAAFVAAVSTALRRPGYAAALLIAVTPFAFPHAIAGTTITLGKAVLAGVLAGLCMRVPCRAGTGFPRLLGAAFAAIIFVNFATVAVAAHRIEAVRESLKWVEYAAFFAAIFFAYAADPRVRVVRTIWMLSMMLVAVCALAELFTGAGSVLLVTPHVLPRIAGALEGPNQLGGYLEVAIAAIAAWQVRDPDRRGASILALMGMALALSFSRAALGGTGLALLVIAWNERGLIVRAWALVAGAIAGYAAVLAGTPELSAGALFSAIAGERASDSYAALSGGVGTRSELWRAALALFRSHPVLGVGAGNYQYDLAQAGLRGVRTQANNWYLQALAEGGIVLFAATSTWIVAVFAALRSHVRRSPWALGALAASVAMVAHGFADDLMFYPKVAETWIALIALGCVRSSFP
jgi:O-antigen ligase